MAENSIKKMGYLYGDLDLHIIEARNLPNMDLTTQRLRRCFAVCEPCFKTPDSPEREEEDHHHVDGGAHDSPTTDKKIHHHQKIITSDPFVIVSVPHATLARTRVLPNSQDPKWKEKFFIPIAHPLEFLEFQVKDDDVFGDQIIGTVKIPVDKIASGERISAWHPLIGPNEMPVKLGTDLQLEMIFIPADKNPVYKHGIAGDPDENGVRNTYFPLRKGNSVTLYQDAHISDDVKLPEIELDDEMIHEQNKCWEDICYAISEAQHLIYIVGWSVFHKIKLIRERTGELPRGGDLTLGELLKYKSEEGVRVLLLVWDDKTSHNKFYFTTAGVMQTHDEETKKFFKHSSVIRVLSRRYASSKLGYMKQKVIGTFFSHHQKCVLVDTEAHGNNRKITAFLGGLDLCDGRYDTPEHRLYRGLDTVFKDDIHQPTFSELICSNKLMIDRSIQTAYIQAIRSAQHFIYIENQYFLGSSYAWLSYKDAGADHQIPMELVLKIVSKIRAGERFAVYVVIPMWPEGDPKSNVMQEILFWQNQTMQMMYKIIAEELKTMRLFDSHPQDYLNFYCLGKREEIPDTMSEFFRNADKVSDSVKYRRFMIYVHAKGMIVDDEYVIIGSANINQRSMAGTKDTEIAMGAYQPHHTWEKKHRHPRGQIYGYRMSLWAEHLGLGKVEKCFEDPETLECVKRVNEIADGNWKKYTDESFVLLQGHLLKYPVHVDAHGNVCPLPGYESFPDVGGRITGACAAPIPDILTT